MALVAVSAVESAELVVAQAAASAVGLAVLAGTPAVMQVASGAALALELAEWAAGLVAVPAE